LSGHPDDAVRILMLSERLRNLEPRLSISSIPPRSTRWSYWHRVRGITPVT
jgi:hypothetical protein